METTNELPRWSPRVPPEKIRRLYESEARGLTDEALLEDVLIGFYLRCRSVAIATAAAMRGEVPCPRCDTLILHPIGSKDDLVRCRNCTCSLTWGEYYATIQHQHLFWGGAFPAVREFVDGFNRARNSRDKILLIDRLIHACHWQMTHYPGRPAAMLVIEGREKEVIELIEGLAYADNCPPELRAGREDWLRRRERQELPAHARPWKEELRSVLDAGYYEEGDAFTRRLRDQPETHEKTKAGE